MIAHVAGVETSCDAVLALAVALLSGRCRIDLSSNILVLVRGLLTMISERQGEASTSDKGGCGVSSLNCGRGGGGGGTGDAERVWSGVGDVSGECEGTDGECERAATVGPSECNGTCAVKSRDDASGEGGVGNRVGGADDGESGDRDASGVMSTEQAEAMGQALSRPVGMARREPRDKGLASREVGKPERAASRKLETEAVLARG